MELSRFLRPSILKFDDWFINVSIGGTGGEDSNIQKDVYFSGKNAYLYASTGSGVTELHIFGNSVQDGTPSIENPVPIISVGENYLQLYSLDINDPSKSGQIIDFGNIKLRSLPNGVCDEIVYQNGQWKHIQRIVSIIIDKNTTIQDQLAASNRVTIRVNYTLITKASANNTNLCSKISNSASSVPHFHNYPNTIYVVWDSNKPATFAEAKSLIMGAEFLCELAEPVETILDLPKLQTLNGTTYLLTNDQQVKPYLQGYYDVDLKVSGKKLEYIREGLMSRWQPINLNNADKPDRVADRVGGSDLITTGFGYITESGFNPTYAQLDGIDDGLINTQKYEPESIKHVQITLSNISNADGKADAYCVSINNYGGGKRQGISNEGTISTGVGGTSFFLDAEQVDGYPGIYDDTDAVLNIALQNTDDSADLKIITVGVAYRDYAATAAKERFYEAVAYNRALSGEEIQNNFLVSQVRNGVNIPDSVDPIDIIAERIYASGKKFPVYNTYRDRDNDNIESFQILGYTVQDGTPTPEAPVPLLSVGDGGLKLCISDSETGIALQVVDFGDIVLRSLPDGTCDSIEWDGTQWKYIQRIEHIHIDGSINITKIVNNTNLNISYVNIPVSIVNGQNVKPYSSMYCNRKLYRKNGYNIADSIFTVDANTYFYITYLNDTGEPYTSDDIKAINDEYPLDIYYAINEPIETILEDLPAPQTFDNETWFGTPSALVKPYMMCECKVKRALKYQGDISAWWYFGGNKSNETDRQITDISGNGNDLTPYNFAWTRESGWNQGGICSDGIDDYLIYNEELSIENILIITSEFENNSGGVKYVLGFRSDNNNGGLCLTAKNRMVSANRYLASSPNNVLPEPLNYLLLTNNVSNYSSGISLLTFFATYYYCSNGTLHEVILFEDYLTDSEYDNNLKVAKQRNGVDGDINIIPEPEVYYDFSLYNNTDFPTTIENLASDKSKTLQLFNFAGTEESGFFEGALVSDGVDDYAIIQNQTEGFKTVFLDIINLSTNTFIYDQRISASNSVETNTFGIFTTKNSIAYNERNSGLTYVDGVENNTVRCNDLITKRNVITITNNIVTKNNSKIPIFFKNALSNGYFAKVHIRKFLGFKEALTAEQIQKIINQYFLEFQLLDSQGNELTDSQGYYLTVAS